MILIEIDHTSLVHNMNFILFHECRSSDFIKLKTSKIEMSPSCEDAAFSDSFHLFLEPLRAHWGNEITQSVSDEDLDQNFLDVFTIASFKDLAVRNRSEKIKLLGEHEDDLETKLMALYFDALKLIIKKHLNLMFIFSWSAGLLAY